MMPSRNTKISDLGEKKLVRRLLSRSQTPGINSLFLNKISIESLSDDAALLDLGDNFLVLCSDMLMQSTHFPEEMSYHQIGQKVVAVNVSDLAAMGSETIGIIVSMGLPKTMLVEEFDELVEGILNACQKYGMPLIGGDTNEASELTLCGTCIGKVKKEHVLMKSGAKQGDVIAVTGQLGLAASGFKVLEYGPYIDEDVKNMVIKHALEPEAKLNEGKLLSSSGYVSSATDITDGILSELGEIIDSNHGKVGIVLNQDDLPIPAEVFKIAEITDSDPFEMAMAYGEDFELVFTISPEGYDFLKSEINIYKIGQIDSSGTIKMIDKKGNTNIITPRGYEHLK